MFIWIILSIIIASLIFKFGMKNIKKQAVQEVLDEYFNERDLPVLDTIDLSKNIDIKLYGLKYEDEDNEVYDRNDITYIKLVEIINNPKSEYIKYDFTKGEDGINIDVKTVDFESDDYKLVYLELISLATSFNLSQFVFRNEKGEIDFKLLNLEKEAIQRMKGHTNMIIEKIFNHIIIDLLPENTENELLQKAFSEAFN